MSASTPVVVCSGLVFAWPDTAAVFSGLSLSIGPGRTGLIGLNGSGKSTLLRLIAGELRPAGGSVTVTGELGYLPQNLTLSPGARVQDALGIGPIRAALNAIEAGDASPENFALVGGDWDVEERASATLDRLGLGHVPLDRAIGDLSGGEAVLLSLAALVLRRPGVLLLDEPTNNLDLASVRQLSGALPSYPGALIVASHDAAFLRGIGLTRWLRLDGELAEAGPL